MVGVLGIDLPTDEDIPATSSFGFSDAQSGGWVLEDKLCGRFCILGKAEKCSCKLSYKQLHIECNLLVVSK